MYANRDVYLLDDPLSAVDAHVGRRIFNNCIRVLLRGKTVLLVTHQLQYLPQCDKVAFMEEQRLQMGKYKDLLVSSAGFNELIRHHHEEHEADEVCTLVVSTVKILIWQFCLSFFYFKDTFEIKEEKLKVLQDLANKIKLAERNVDDLSQQDTSTAAPENGVTPRENGITTTTTFAPSENGITTKTTLAPSENGAIATVPPVNVVHSSDPRNELVEVAKPSEQLSPLQRDVLYKVIRKG